MYPIRDEENLDYIPGEASRGELNPCAIENDAQACGVALWMRRKARERNRRLAAAREMIETCELDIEAIQRGYEEATSASRANLYAYMRHADVKRTKTQRSYALPLGARLIERDSAPKFTRDDTALLAWAQRTGCSDYIRQTVVPNWAAIRADCDVAAGRLVYRATGEIVPGVTVEAQVPKFVVDISKIDPEIREV